MDSYKRHDLQSLHQILFLEIQFKEISQSIKDILAGKKKKKKRFNAEPAQNRSIFWVNHIFSHSCPSLNYEKHLIL